MLHDDKRKYQNDLYQKGVQTLSTVFPDIDLSEIEETAREITDVFIELAETPDAERNRMIQKICKDYEIKRYC